ncbi:autotransporter outer membrane beta-barrel domain-containing protein [Endozoicomonas sp. ALD040]|uniref:autotransporter outer membrane beta-barrel domain-containing protein n=1 Tax=Endozoicomonas sp. ALD040 TaxID=3403079 RepID=UPI003BB09180
MRQVQVFNKTLLSIAVVTALGGYSKCSQAQFLVNNKDFFKTVEKVDLSGMVKVRNEMLSDDPLIKQADKAVKRYEVYKVKHDEKQTDAERLFINASFWKQLEIDAPDFLLLSERSVSADDRKPKESESLVKRERAVLGRAHSALESLGAAETQSSFSGQDYGLDKHLFKKDGQSLNEARNAYVKRLVELENLALRDAILVEKEVVDESTRKTKKVKVAPDAIILKGIDLSDGGVRKTVLEKLTNVEEVFELKTNGNGKVTGLGFKTRVLELADVSSGFKEGERVPVVASAATEDEADVKAYGTVVLSGRSSAVHEGFGTSERALDAFVAKEGTSVRIAKDGAIRSTIIYLKGVDDVTGVDVEVDGKKTKTVDTFLDLVGVLPEQLEIMEEAMNKHGKKVHKPIARKAAVAVIDGAKKGTVNLKGYEDIEIKGSRLVVRQIGVAEDGVTPASANVTITDSDITVDAGSDDIANAGKGVVAGQNIVLSNTHLSMQEENKIALESIISDELEGNDNTRKMKQLNSITVTEIKAVPVKGLNAQKAMEGSIDGFAEHVVDVEAEDVLDVFEVRKGSVSHVSLTDIEKVLVEDGQLYADEVSTLERPLVSFDLRGKATVRSMSNDAQPVFVSRDADVTLAVGQEVSKDIHGFRHFILDGGTLEGSLQGFAAENGDEKDPERFTGSTVTLKKGTLKGGEIGGVVDGKERGHLKEVLVTGQIDVKPGTTELRTLDRVATKKSQMPIFQSTELKQVKVVAPLVVDSKGSLKLFKTFKQSKLDEKNTPVLESAPSLLATKGKTLEKGANLFLVVDGDDKSLSSVPYVSVDGSLKLQGQNQIKLDLTNSIDSKKRFENAKNLYEEAKSGKPLTASIAVIEADKVEGSFVAPDTGTVFIDASDSGFAKSEKTGKSVYSINVKYDDNPVQKLRSQYSLSEDQAKMYIATYESALSTDNMVSSQSMFNLVTMAEQQDIKLFADQQLPDLNNAVGRASVTLQNKVNESIGRRLNSNRTGVNAGDMYQSQGFWAEYIFNNGKLDNDEVLKGYQARVNGVTLGADTTLNDQMTVGFAFTYGNTKVETNDIHRETATDTYMGTLYTGWNQNNYFLDSMFSYGKGVNEYKRKVQLEKTAYRGEADSTVWGARLVAGYNYQINQWVLQPQVTFGYNSVKFDDLTEKQTGDWAQKCKMKEFEVMELGAGLKLMGDFELGRGILQPEFVLMGYHDFKDEKPEATVTILQGGKTLTFTGAEREQNRFLAGLGVNYKMENNLSLSLHYDNNWMGDFKADSLNATIRYDF